jgi:general stress protein 26
MTELNAIAPEFLAMAHRIVWCTVATVDAAGSPRTRVLHPIWEWDGTGLTGWIATSPQSPKSRDLAETPQVSLTYWDATQDTCTADCSAVWENDLESRQRGWNRFANGPAPVGYDPRLIPGWTSPDVPSFGILRLEPTRLRLMPGSLMMRGVGELLTWTAPD